MIAPQPWPQYGLHDRVNVLAVLDSGELTGDGHAPFRDQFEKEWGNYIGSHYVSATNGGTNALYCALVAMGIGRGDSVIVPALTFSGTAHAVLMAGADVIWVDVDPLTFNMDPSAFLAAIRPDTAAVIPVHLHGLMADMPAICAIAQRNGLAVIEDACQAIGASLLGGRPGMWGDAAAFSLNHTQPLPAGEGGIVVTQNLGIHHRIRSARVFGENTDSSTDHARPYTVHGRGGNFLLPELSAAVALAQLKGLDDRLARAKHNAVILSSLIGDEPAVSLPFVPHSYTHAYHKYRVLIKTDRIGIRTAAGKQSSRNTLLSELGAAGVSVGLWHTEPLPAFPHFGGAHREDFPVASNVLDSSFLVCDERHPLLIQDEAYIRFAAHAIKRSVISPIPAEARTA